MSLSEVRDQLFKKMGLDSSIDQKELISSVYSPTDILNKLTIHGKWNPNELNNIEKKRVMKLLVSFPPNLIAAHLSKKKLSNDDSSEKDDDFSTDETNISDDEFNSDDNMIEGMFENMNPSEIVEFVNEFNDNPMDVKFILDGTDKDLEVGIKKLRTKFERKPTISIKKALLSLNKIKKIKKKFDKAKLVANRVEAPMLNSERLQYESSSLMTLKNDLELYEFYAMIVKKYYQKSENFESDLDGNIKKLKQLISKRTSKKEKLDLEKLNDFYSERLWLIQMDDLRDELNDFKLKEIVYLRNKYAKEKKLNESDSFEALSLPVYYDDVLDSLNKIIMAKKKQNESKSNSIKNKVKTEENNQNLMSINVQRRINLDAISKRIIMIDKKIKSVRPDYYGKLLKSLYYLTQNLFPNDLRYMLKKIKDMKVKLADIVVNYMNVLISYKVKIKK